jgi:hypothetical protein
MFHDFQLARTISTDRQNRLRNAATRRRLVRPNRAPPVADPATAGLVAIVWPDDVERLASQQRAHCAA